MEFRSGFWLACFGTQLIVGRNRELSEWNMFDVAIEWWLNGVVGGGIGLFGQYLCSTLLNGLANNAIYCVL